MQILPGHSVAKYNRAFEPGYVLAAMNDVSQRRGIWYRHNKEENSIEICAGREGDDGYVKIQAGQTVTPEMVKAIEEIMSTGAWMVDRQKEILREK